MPSALLQLGSFMTSSVSVLGKYFTVASISGVNVTAPVINIGLPSGTVMSTASSVALDATAVKLGSALHTASCYVEGLAVYIGAATDHAYSTANAVQIGSMMSNSTTTVVGAASTVGVSGSAFVSASNAISIGASISSLSVAMAINTTIDAQSLIRIGSSASTALVDIQSQGNVNVEANVLSVTANLTLNGASHTLIVGAGSTGHEHMSRYRSDSFRSNSFLHSLARFHRLNARAYAGNERNSSLAACVHAFVIDHTRGITYRSIPSFESRRVYSVPSFDSHRYLRMHRYVHRLNETACVSA